MRLPSKPDSDGSAASESLIQYVDAEFASPPDRVRRAKSDAEARVSAEKWAAWVGVTLRAGLQEELMLQRQQVPQDTIRIAALETALVKIQGW